MEYFPHDRIVAQSCLNRRLVDTGQVFDVYDLCLREGLKPVMELIKTTNGVFGRGHPDDLSLEELREVLTKFGEIRQKNGLEPFPMHPTSYGNFCHMFRTGVADRRRRA